MATRADPFSTANEPIDVSDFTAAPRNEKRKEVDQAELSSLAKASGFDRSITARPVQEASAPAALLPPAALKQRRYTTGRDTQLNLKCKPETKREFTRLADEAQISLGAMFERMIESYLQTYKGSR